MIRIITLLVLLPVIGYSQINRHFAVYAFKGKISVIEKPNDTDTFSTDEIKEGFKYKVTYSLFIWGRGIGTQPLDYYYDSGRGETSKNYKDYKDYITYGMSSEIDFLVCLSRNRGKKGCCKFKNGGPLLTAY